jgi:hypothetical protein
MKILHYFHPDADVCQRKREKWNNDLQRNSPTHSPNKHCGTQVAGCYVKAASGTERKTTFSLNKRKTDRHPPTEIPGKRSRLQCNDDTYLCDKIVRNEPNSHLNKMGSSPVHGCHHNVPQLLLQLCKSLRCLQHNWTAACFYNVTFQVLRRRV